MGRERIKTSGGGAVSLKLQAVSLSPVTFVRLTWRWKGHLVQPPARGRGALRGVPAMRLALPRALQPCWDTRGARMRLGMGTGLSNVAAVVPPLKANIWEESFPERA